MGPILFQPTFNWKVPDRYVELLNFEMDVTNVLQVYAYDLNDEEKVHIIKNQLGREGYNLYRLSLMLRKRHAKVEHDCLMFLKKNSGHSIIK